MNRRVALTFAGATAIIVTAASGAVAANVGILNSGNQKPVGNLSASNVAELSTRPTVAVAAPATTIGATPIAPGAPEPTTIVVPRSGGGVSTAEVGSVSGPSDPVIADPAPVTTLPVVAPGPPVTIAPTPPTTQPAPRHEDADGEHETEGHDDDD